MEELITVITQRRGNIIVPVEKGAKKGGGWAREEVEGEERGRGGANELDLDEEEGKHGVPVPLYLLPLESSSVEWHTTNPKGVVSPRRFVRDKEDVK